MVKLFKREGGRASELFQSLDIKFAYVNKDGENYSQCHREIKCRDFLGDCIWSKKKQLPVDIYSFRYSYIDSPYDADATRLSLSFPDKETLAIFKDNFHLLNEKEEEYDVAKSTLVDTDNPLSLIVEANKVWQSCVWKMSLFTYYIKIYSYKSLNELQEPEDAYVATLTDVAEDKFKAAVNLEEEILADDINLAHNYSGFISIIKGRSEMNKIIMNGDK